MEEKIDFVISELQQIQIESKYTNMVHLINSLHTLESMKEDIADKPGEKVFGGVVRYDQ